VIDFLVLLSIPALSQVFSKSVSLWLTLTGVLITGCATAVLFGSVLGMSALFPPSYTGAVMSGNGIAGLVSIFLRIITKVSLPNSTRGLKFSSMLFFGLAAFTILICVVSFVVLLKLPVTQYYLLKNKPQKKDYDSINTTPLLQTEARQQTTTATIVLKKIWREALMAFLVFFVTLSLFPGITSEIKSKSLTEDWFQIILISLFMVCDFVGRTLPRWIQLFKSQTLWIPILSRFLFFVLFALCIKPRIFESDYAAYAIMILFALSNGYCGTLAMMYGPTRVEEFEKELAGTTMSFFLNLGIFIAVHFAVLLLYFVTGNIGIKF